MSFQPEERGPPSLTGGLLESETKLHELSAELIFAVPVSSMLGFLSPPLCWVFFAFCFHRRSFRWVGLLLCLASTSRGLSWVCFSQVKSESWHHRCWGSVWFPWFCLATAKIWSDGWISVKALYSSLRWTSVTVPCNLLGWTSVTALLQFYLESKGKYILKAWWQADPKDEKRSSQLNLGSSFYSFFFFFPPPLEPAVCKFVN